MTTRLIPAIAVLLLATACAGGADEQADGAPPAGREAGERPAVEERGFLSRLASGGGPEYREVIVPEGTVLRVGLGTRLSSASSSVEDPVRGVLREAVVIDGVEVLPEGATLQGAVLHAERSGRVKGVAHLAFRFTELDAHGQAHPVSTTRLAYAAEPSQKEDAAKIGIGAGAGAIAGAIAGGRKGAAIGSGIGAAAGTGVVLTTRGEEVTLAPGMVVTTRLTAPLPMRIPLD